MFNLDTALEPARDRLVAIAFQDLESGAEFYLHADEPMHPASTIKVHVMMEVFRQANEGRFSLEDRIPIINSFSSIADGSLFFLDVDDDAEQTLYSRTGESERIEELVRLMIVRSSNLATNILLNQVGAQNVSGFIHALGIEGVTFLRGIEDNAAHRLGLDNRATARGLTQTMNLIARKKVVSEQASEHMIQILLGQEFNESIPALLPNSARVAHKTGWNGDVYHDTGIVYPQAHTPYVLSIMCGRYSEDTEAEAHQVMAGISRAIYEQLTGLS